MADIHVLVVDDESRVADTYALQLRSAYETTVAYSGEDAIDILEEQGDDIDVILLDRRMPGITGDQVAEWIRTHGLDCGVAMVTAVEPDFDIIQLGFDDYILKPVSGEGQLHELVERLARQRSYDEHVREHLGMVATKAVLEAKKNENELLNNDDYIQLRSKILESRQQLDEVLQGDVFVQVLLQEFSTTLEVVLQYESDSWQYRYVSERFEERLGILESDVGQLLEQFRSEGERRSALAAEYNLGTYACSLHLYAAVLFINFYQPDGSGILCGFAPKAAPNITTFVSFVRPYLNKLGISVGDL